jgi:hypothetical protein
MSRRPSQAGIRTENLRRAARRLPHFTVPRTLTTRPNSHHHPPIAPSQDRPLHYTNAPTRRPRVTNGVNPQLGEVTRAFLLSISNLRPIFGMVLHVAQGATLEVSNHQHRKLCGVHPVRVAEWQTR